MALEEELMTAGVEEETAEKKSENFDDLTDDEIEAVKELEKSEGWKVLVKCMKKRKDQQEKDLVVLAKDHFMEPKKLGYTAFEVLGGLLQGMGEMERLVKVITADPEEIKKAVELLNNMEKEQVEGKEE